MEMNPKDEKNKENKMSQVTPDAATSAEVNDGGKLKEKLDEQGIPITPEEVMEPELVEELDVLKKELEQKDSEATEFKDKYLRAVAEMENIKRRSERERSDLMKFGNEKIMTDLLPVLDSFEKALEDSTAPESDDVASYQEGVRMVRKQLWDTLEKNGLSEVSLQGVFDPNIHQAISRLESPDAIDETIKEVFAKGYLLHGRLLRPAMVSVEVPRVGNGN